MAREYKVSFMVRMTNRLMAGMIRGKSAPEGMYLLTVHGRKTGKAYSAPVTLMANDGKRWLVAPYGEVNWVKNARVTGEVNLARKGTQETLRIKELGPKESAPVLKEYITKIAIVRPYFNILPEATLEEFEAEAAQHPVFELEQK
ncbi:MAG TPA: nitroreductase/quinone reductase family protein [Anaerolineales bacterium]|nr:nitroreductase/quinone reductase family protein [Anaerolineales bacterium]